MNEQTKTAPPGCAPTNGSGTGQPVWAAQCLQCRHLKQTYGGRWWKCRAIHPSGWTYGWCADARSVGGICGPEGRAFEAKSPNAKLCRPADSEAGAQGKESNDH